MLSYIVHRVLLMIPTLFGITMLVFFVMGLSPDGVGGPALTEEGNLRADQQRRYRAYYEKRYGLDKPLVVQYGRWLNLISPIGYGVRDDGTLGAFGFKAPSLGTSLNRHRPVADLILEALPVTILLNLISIPLIYGISLLSGIIAARLRGGWFDVASGMFFLALWSIPPIWAGVMLIGMLANQQYVDWFPTGGLHSMRAEDMAFLPSWGEDGFERGWLLDLLWHLVLPVVCLSYGGFALLSRLARTSVLENLHADFVRTARAKGVGERDVLFRHVLRNSLIPLLTVAAVILPELLSGSIVIEKIFSLPGMGRLGVEAVINKDRELVLAITLLAGLVGLVAELIRDVAYAIADPRVSYE
jgi:peptide/nickel transport system permease protein